MAHVEFDEAVPFEAGVEVAIVGAGAAGLVAALAAAEVGAKPLVIERDPVPRGSTALSAGLIPAAETRWQREHGIVDSPARFAKDIARKAEGLADPALVVLVSRASGPAIEWLAQTYALPLSLAELEPALADDRLIAVRQLRRERVDQGGAG